MALAIFCCRSGYDWQRLLRLKDMTPDKDEEPILVDYKSLQPATLRSLIEDFVTRGGTDYGETEVSMEQRVADVLAQLVSGKAVVSFDAAAASTTIMLTRNSRTQ